jgi:hypothetical protein
MKQQNNLESNNQQPVIEDLTVHEEQAAAVKGGESRTFYAFPGFSGGVWVAAGD